MSADIGAPTESDSGNIVQLIDEHLHVPVDTPELLSKFNLADRVDYCVVAVMGVQSSGKSTRPHEIFAHIPGTLLNKLFGTNFAVMNAAVAQQQTTRGVWIGKATNENPKNQTILVCDIEGSDSYERGEQKHIERKIALFSLALSEVLIINMNARDVGLQHNFPLFRIILELNLSLFGVAQKKLLLFVFRDWAKKTPLERLAQSMQNAFEEEWKTITKPPQYADVSLSQLYDFDFVALPNYDVLYEEWEEDVASLKSRFYEPDHQQYLLQEKYRRDSIPFDGFPQFISQLWDVITSEKDLDLPTQRELLAKYRCDEISKETFKKVETEKLEFDKTYKETGLIVQDFGARCVALLEETLVNYDGLSRRYDVSIATQYRSELRQRILGHLEESFRAQVYMLHQASLTKFQENLKKSFPGQTPTSDFKAKSEKMQDKIIQSYTETCQKLSQDLWSYTEDLNQFTEAVRRDLKITANKEVDLLIKELQSDSKERLNNALYGTLNDVARDMWPVIRKKFAEEATACDSQLTTRLSEFAGLVSESEIAQYQEATQKLCLETLKSIVEAKVLDIDRQMLQKFKKIFLHDNEGSVRSWKPSDDIKAIFKQAKIAGESVLDQFCILRMEGVEEGPIFFKLGEAGVEEIENPPTLSSDVVLMKKSEAHRALERFRDSANSELAMAQKDQEHAVSNSKVPTYMILLCLILGANEIYWVFSTLFFNPLGYLFLILIGLVALVVYQSGLAPTLIAVVKPVANQAIQQAKEAIGLAPVKQKKN